MMSVHTQVGEYGKHKYVEVVLFPRTAKGFCRFKPLLENIRQSGDAGTYYETGSFTLEEVKFTVHGPTVKKEKKHEYNE